MSIHISQTALRSRQQTIFVADHRICPRNFYRATSCSNFIAVMATSAFITINRICSRNYYRTANLCYQFKQR